MDDIASKITELLKDPEGMQKIQSMANSIMGESATSPQPNVPEMPQIPQMPEMNFDPSQMASMMKVASLFGKQSKEDDNTRLLVALKPHLSEERRGKVDKAISLMRIVKLLPALKDSGIMNILGG